MHEVIPGYYFSPALEEFFPVLAQSSTRVLLFTNFDKFFPVLVNSSTPVLLTPSYGGRGGGRDTGLYGNIKQVFQE